MATERGKRVYRDATDEERIRHSDIRSKIAAELPEIRQRARERLGRYAAAMGKQTVVLLSDTAT